MTPEERAILRSLRMDIDGFHVIVAMVENGVRNGLVNAGVAKGVSFKLTDEVWQDVTTAIARCHASIDKLTQKRH